MLTMNITGIQTTKNQLKNKINPDKIQEALIRGGLMIEKDAKRECPVDTGRLRASISTNWPNSGNSHGNVEAPAEQNDGVSRPHKSPGDIAIVRVGTNVKYATYVHDGTRRQASRPFILNAALNNQARIKKIIDNSL